MIILGVTHPIGWHGGACLIADGKLLAMVEEERLNRIKHAPMSAPNLAVDFCLKKSGIDIRDVDYVAVGYDAPTNILLANVFKNIKRFAARQPVIFSLKSAVYCWLRDYFALKGFSFRLKEKKVIFVRHHLAHAASSYFLSGFQETNIISLDGGGGQEAGILAAGEENNIRILKYIDRETSWGKMYEDFTKLLGFGKGSEGKTMALAGYGRPQAKDFPFINWDGEIPRIDYKSYQRYKQGLIPRKKGDSLTDEHKNIAASVQEALEKAILRMSLHLYKRTGYRNLCLAGGVGLNCCLNSKLLNSSNVENIFIQPASYDAGTALGAAIHVFVEKTKHRPKINFNQVYWGPEYTNQEIVSALEMSKVRNYEKCSDICKKTAALLAQGKIIGWFQGRMEIGPRALGNRSIIAAPSNSNLRDKVNRSVKQREIWRPFSPSILSEYTDEYLEKPYPSAFMLLRFKVKADKMQELKAVTHIDGTCRPQSVEKDVNPKFWRLINEFRKLSGVAAILNTSFNIEGQPIVCTPSDALSTFFRCGLDYLIMEDYLVWK